MKRYFDIYPFIPYMAQGHFIAWYRSTKVKRERGTDFEIY